jgi:hypothetical protein
MGLMAIGAVMAASAVMSGVQQKNAADTSAQMARDAADNSRITAGQQLAVGEADAQRTQRNTQRTVATAETGMAAGGVDIGSGSPLAVMGDISAEGALDAQIQRWRSNNAARSSMIGAGQQDNQAAIDENQGSNALAGGFIKAGSTILSAYANNEMLNAPYRKPSISNSTSTTTGMLG